MLRKTKIICTLGPAVDSEEMIRALVCSGMNAARFNFSHGSHLEHQQRLERLKRVRDELGCPVATILDTKGPEIRIRSFAEKTVELVAGAPFVLTTREVEGDCTCVGVTYSRLHEELEPGQEILIDDGLIAVRVEEICGQDILCRVENGGTLSSNKSLNIPGVHIRLPALTDKDVDDIRFGVEQGFDYIAASFVRRASDVEEVRRVLHACGGEDVKIIAKIENQEGVDNMPTILEAADGIMVARGDLGVEIPASKVPILQKRMIQKGMEVGKPIITATQMLDSMMRNPRPTRAEVSDVANAVFDGSSCVMLSGETASGKYPIEALTAMARIVADAEDSIHYWRRFQKRQYSGEHSINDSITHTCCKTAMDLEAKVILVATQTGHSARKISRFRPACPIVALTVQEQVRRQMALNWGVIPFLIGDVTSTDHLFAIASEVALAENLVRQGDVVVIAAGVPLGRAGTTNLVKAHTIEGN